MELTYNDLVELFENERRIIDIYNNTQLLETVENEKINVDNSNLSRFRTVYALIKLNCLDKASYYLYKGVNIDNIYKHIYLSKNGKIVPNVFTPGYTYYPPDNQPSGGGGDDCCDDCCDNWCDCLEDSPIKAIIAVLAVLGIGALVVCNFGKILDFCGSCCCSAAEGLLECVCDDLLGC